MRSSIVFKFLVATLVIAPLASVAAWNVSGADGGNLVVKVLFAATVLIEIVALKQALAARKLFSRSDTGYLTWSLTIAFLLVRLVAEARLVTLTFDLFNLPKSITAASPGAFFYVVWLRYLYTISDALFIGALLTTVRAYQSTGLKFGVQGRDYIYIALVCAVPVTTFFYRANLGLAGLINTDHYIATYRLVAVFSGGIIASLCLVVRRYVAQMGGGAVARVWNSVVVAGIARDASFLVLAVVSKFWKPGAEFGEQYLLWIFALCWVLAALYQQELIPQAKQGVPETAGSVAIG
jgi:hypothetical protein